MEITVIASGSKGNAYRISDGRTALLLEAGIPFPAIRQALAFRVRELAGCLVSHAHGDHAKAAGALAKAGVDVYTSKGTINACGLTGHRVKTVNPLQPFRVGTFTVLPFDVQHDAPEPLGFLVRSNLTGEKLLFFTDTYYLKYRFDGLTHIMCECNFETRIAEERMRRGELPAERFKRLVQSHMSLEHLLDLLRANDLSRVRQIYLMHLSEDNSDEQHCRDEVRKLTGAEVYICK